MPFAFLIVGIMLVVSGVRGKTATLLGLVKNDFTGQKNFIYWTVSILLIGSLGYVDDLKPLSRAMLVLVICVLILSNGGFFQLFNQALQGLGNSSDNSTPSPSFGGASGGAGASGSW